MPSRRPVSKKTSVAGIFVEIVQFHHQPDQAGTREHHRRVQVADLWRHGTLQQRQSIEISDEAASTSTGWKMLLRSSDGRGKVINRASLKRDLDDSHILEVGGRNIPRPDRFASFLHRLFT